MTMKILLLRQKERRKVLDACSDNIYIEESRAALNRDDLLSRVEQMASEGRVLALARKITDKKSISKSMIVYPA